MIVSVVVAGRRESMPHLSNSTGKIGVDTFGLADELGPRRGVLNPWCDAGPEMVEGDLEGLTGKGRCSARPDADEIRALFLDHEPGEVDEDARLGAIGGLRHGSSRFVARDSDREMRSLRSVPAGRQSAPSHCRRARCPQPFCRTCC